AQAATMLMGFVDLLMVGRLGGGALAAIGLANPWVFGTLFFASGVIFGMDPLVTQAHGARDGKSATRAFQRGMLLALPLSALVLLAWSVSETVLLATGQQPALARGAAQYIDAQLFSIPFFLCNVALRQYMQGREVVRPAMIVVLIANVANAFLNWVLIFGNLGFPALGLEGAGIATGVVRVLSLFLLALAARRHHLLRADRLPWRDRALLSPAGYLPLFRLGVPIALQLSLEMWFFGLSNWIAGRIGGDAVAGHVVVIHMASFSFMFVTGVSQAATIRVGNLLGAGRARDAERSAWIGIALGALVMLFFAALFLLGRRQIPRIYTNDLAVIAVAVSVVPLAAAFQIFDGIQNV
ncbi:MAG: MATE family efflux transporter, partial [bacterium]